MQEHGFWWRRGREMRRQGSITPRFDSGSGARVRVLQGAEVGWGGRMHDGQREAVERGVFERSGLALRGAQGGGDGGAGRHPSTQASASASTATGAQASAAMSSSGT